jgi:hypothetical protein
MKAFAALSIFGALVLLTPRAQAQSPSMRGAFDHMKLAAQSTSREPASIARSYTCNASDDGLFDGMDPIRVTISGSKLVVAYKGDGGADRSGSGSIDRNYKPRKNAAQVRFSGKFEDLIDDSGSVMVIANKNILEDTTKKTWVKLQWTGEAFESSFYSCSFVQ